MAMTASWIPRGASEFLRAEPQVSYAGPMSPSDTGDQPVAMIQVHGLAGGRDTRPHTEAEHAEVHKRMGLPADHPCKVDGPIC